MDAFFRKLRVIEDCYSKLSDLKRENPSFEHYQKSWKDKDSVERNLQKVIEAIVDLGKLIIIEKKLPEPGNNREIFQILIEASYFPEKLYSLTDQMLGMRNILVHGYDKVDDEIVYGIVKKHLKDIRTIKNTYEALVNKLASRKG